MLWGQSLQFWQTVVFWLWSIAAVTGATAVAASFGSSIVSYYISDATETAAKIEVDRAKADAGRANEAAGKANERAGTANEAAGKANETAAELQVRAGQLEREAAAARERAATMEARVSELNLEIAKIKSPRELTADQTTKLVEACSKFSGTDFELASTDGDAETRDFMLKIGNALLLAGWKINSSTMNTIRYKLAPDIQYGVFTGKNVTIGLHQKSKSTLEPAAQALASELRSLGFVAGVDISDWKSLGEGGSDLSTEHIIVAVGKK